MSSLALNKKPVELGRFLFPPIRIPKNVALSFMLPKLGSIRYKQPQPGTVARMA